MKNSKYEINASVRAAGAHLPVFVSAALSSAAGQTVPCAAGFALAVTAGQTSLKSVTAFVGMTAGYLLSVGGPGGSGIIDGLPYISAGIILVTWRLLCARNLFGRFSGRAKNITTAILTGIAIAASACTSVSRSEITSQVVIIPVAVILGVLLTLSLLSIKKEVGTGGSPVGDLACSRPAEVRKKPEKPAAHPVTYLAEHSAAKWFLLYAGTVVLTPLRLGLMINIGMTAAFMLLLYISSQKNIKLKPVQISLCAGLAVSAGLAAAMHSAGAVSAAVGAGAAGLTASWFPARNGAYSQKICRASAFLVTMTVTLIITADSSALFGDYTAMSVGSGVLACVLYVILPIDAPRYDIKEADGYSESVTTEFFSHRLSETADALCEIRNAVARAGKVLDDNPYSDFGSLTQVYTRAADETCSDCINSRLCWGVDYSATTDGMEKLMKQLRCGVHASENDLPRNVKDICLRKSRLTSAINNHYAKHTSNASAYARVTQARTVLLSQFRAMENLIKSLSDELMDYDGFDAAATESVRAALSNAGLQDVTAAVRLAKISADGTDEQERRMFAEIYAVIPAGTVISDERLCDIVSNTLNRDFDLPDALREPIESTRANGPVAGSNTVTGGNTVAGGGFADTHLRAVLYESAKFAVEFGAYQICRGRRHQENQGKDSGVCGDFYDSFVDRNGCAYIVLADGMGAGSRARIDSSFSCGMFVKLLRAGVNIDTAAALINTSLLVKSTDESFSTLDICKINLYTGEAELYKAGGAPSYVKCNPYGADTAVVRAESKGLPVGMLYEPKMEVQTFKVGGGDIILLCSDGAEINETALNRTLKQEPKNLRELSENLARASRSTGEAGREDDITVIAARLLT